MSAAKTVAIIGAGPVGLAAAAHVLERGLTPIVLEAGDDVGHAVRQWGHVQLFSPWEYNIDRAAERLLASTGLEFPRARAVSDRRRTGGALSRTARDQDRACEPHPYLEPRHRYQPRRLRQAEEQGPGHRAVRAALSERARPQNRARPMP